MAGLKWLMTAFLAIEALAACAFAADQTGPHEVVGVAAKLTHGGRATAKEADQKAAPLDRMASAVDGAESSHGQDVAMWRLDPAGPQGPMQVSEAAAADVGGGDRFDLLQNRAIGRAYLQQLFWRYRNWPDAVAAYNWGVGKMDAWIKAGRPAEQFLVGVAVYQRRVLHESGLCNDGDKGRRQQPAEAAKGSGALPPDPLVYAACSQSDGWAGGIGFGRGPTRFSRKLDEALSLALQRAAQGR
ncbi:MAG: lytic transglycosylase domain-containing protein [Alphaproteobacteria bacterium]|nr:lytic transglycosylase domain-containing protein [Alphaproteobacteria bacterium]